MTKKHFLKQSPSIVLVVALLVLGAASVVWYESSGRRKSNVETCRPPIVRVVEIAPAAEFDSKSYPGIARESQVANVSFRVGGKLVESSIIIGARVEKGTVLARLDPRDYELAVQRLESELQAAEATFGAMKTGARPEDLATLETQLAAAGSQYDTAKANLKRFTALLEEQVASQVQFDLAKTQFDAAKGNKETLENELEKAKRGSRKEEIEAMQARIAGLKTSLATARNACDDTRLKAPFDGFVVEKFIEDHEVVAPGMPIASFANASKIDVSVSLPEEMIVHMSDIRAYRVAFEAYPGVFFQAELKEIGRAIQRGKQTYPLLVRIDLTDEESKRRPIFPGMTAMVRIDLQRRERPQTVPLAALIGENEDSAVWVVDADTLVRRPVEILRVLDQCVEIASDLKPGEQVVAAGARSLREHQKVRLENTLENTPENTPRK